MKKRSPYGLEVCGHKGFPPEKVMTFCKPLLELNVSLVQFSIKFKFSYFFLFSMRGKRLISLFLLIK